MKICVIGIGNLIRGDEGIGLIAARYIKRFNLDNVKVVEGEQNFEYSLSEIDSSDYVIIIDSVKMRGIPGTVYKIEIEKCIKEIGKGLSVTSFNLVDYLNILNTTRDNKINGVFVGIEPDDTGYSDKLSKRIALRVGFIINIIKDEIYKNLKTQIIEDN